MGSIIGCVTLALIILLQIKVLMVCLEWSLSTVLSAISFMIGAGVSWLLVYNDIVFFNSVKISMYLTIYVTMIVFTILFMVFYDLIKDLGRIKRKYRE